jgi:hypothetical protein
VQEPRPHASTWQRQRCRSDCVGCLMPSRMSAASKKN